MGLSDRDYYRSTQPTGYGGAGGGGGVAVGLGGRGWSLTIWLIVINVAVFVIDGLLFSQGVNADVQIGNRVYEMRLLEAFGHFSAATAIEGLQVWRFLTFQFLHADLGHLLFNMISLYFFGRLIEGYLGSRRYLAFYLLCGVSGALVYLMLWGAKVLISMPGTPLVGASAGIFGVLMAAARIAPRAKVMLLFPPIPIELRTLAWGLIGIGAYVVLTRGNNAGGEAAHLGGAALGYLLITRPSLLNFAERSRPRGKPGPRGTRTFFEPMSQGPPPRSRDDAAVDRILVKVKENGLQSLTEKEKQTLQRATDDQRRAG